MSKLTKLNLHMDSSRGNRLSCEDDIQRQSGQLVMYNDRNELTDMGNHNCSKSAPLSVFSIDSGHFE